jgi:hypothetical protein
MRRQLVAAGDRLAVERRGVLPLLLRVTTAARGRLERFLVREFLALQVGVAVDAEPFPVDRCVELGLVHVQRNRLAGPLLGKGLVAVARDAVIIRLRRGAPGETEQQRQPEEWNE